jgi:hypothetical protein
MEPLRRRRHHHDIGLVFKKHAKAWRLYFRTAEVAKGEDERAQQVDAELLYG